MANWWSTPAQFWIGRVYYLATLHRPGYKTLRIASSLENAPRFLITWRIKSFNDSMAFGSVNELADFNREAEKTPLCAPSQAATCA